MITEYYVYIYENYSSLITHHESPPPPIYPTPDIAVSTTTNFNKNVLTLLPPQKK